MTRSISSEWPAESVEHSDLSCESTPRTAVERFARWHDADISDPAAYYRELLPLSAPEWGEQYAFEVDLDACSGCKACVAACHQLNGLDEGETWRSVGLLHGGSAGLPVLQHVTTACHHCLEPACLDGCPVYAYEKDPITGIVYHLDDQCIGCQYCILKCPYDVPKYSPARGIVRKCDMCRHRLAVGEAPACVQACPNRAIRITVVDRHDATEKAEANLFLPGSPEPSYTLPTTVYKTNRPLPANLLPADYYAAAPQHAHWPLILMLVLTQMSVGAFTVQLVVAFCNSVAQPDPTAPQAVQSTVALTLGLLGLAASIFHLGRPWLAYRAIVGWRTSWLSREVLAFGAFAACALIYAVSPWLEFLAHVAQPIVRDMVFGGLVLASGWLGVLCSTMIYASTRRPFWNGSSTGFRFSATCFILGLAVAQILHHAAWWWRSHGSDVPPIQLERVLAVGLMLTMSGKLLAEASQLRWLFARTLTPLRRTAVLMTGDLSRITASRFICGMLGGLILPGLLLMLMQGAEPSATSAPVALLLALAQLIACGVGEVLERYLFFAAVVAPKMPGAPQA